MIGFDQGDAFWYVAAVVGAAVMAGIIWMFRRTVRWVFRNLKAGFLDWFAEAVDEHVQPKLDHLRDETLEMSEDVKADVAAKLDQHTSDEGEVVRGVVRDEIAPFVEAFNEHAAADTTRFDAQEAATDRIEAMLSANPQGPPSRRSP